MLKNVNLFKNSNFLQNFKNPKKFSSLNSPSLKIKEMAPTLSSTTSLQYKQFAFKYQNIEYKAELPSNINQSLGEFLEFFAKDRAITLKQNINSKSYEVTRNNKYIPHNAIVNTIKTKIADPFPVIILDDTLTQSNIRFREMSHLRFPYESSSQTLQTFLNGFLESIKIDTSKLEKDYLKVLLKTLDDVKGNKSKLFITIANLIQKIKTENSLEIKSNFNLKLNEFYKNDKEGLILIENKINNLHLPINLVTYKNEEEKVGNFDDAIIDNFDSLRKLSLKFNTRNNFGIVTDFYNWKFNFYQRPDGGVVEEEKDFLTSLKYDLSASSHHLSENNYLILLKVLTGIVTMDGEKMKNLKI
jgi:hypothetical protein